ncbi:MAG TPA: alpha-2-macroglobulin family protein [Kiritimatiellia bacterium]|nr:alpha-2-macroglobulin family protein [Kiritimatiellia bacterium]HPS06220.1 alpha-2-macroglobulin family protein [Kiritimatiellia bacterium]
MKVGASLFLLLSVGMAWAQTDGLEQAWKDVDAAVEKGLPKKAIETLIVIEKQAIERHAWDQAVKAVARRANLESQAKGDKSEEIISALREAASRAPDPMKPFLELLVAHHYWRYFCNNRWRFCQRTQLAEEPEEGGAVGTWSLPRILSAIEAQFQRALAYEPVLKQIPVEAYGALLERGTVSDAYRPTLYDFIAYEMLDFYALGEQAGVRWEDDIDLSADGPALDDVASFTFIIPDEAARRSHVLRALRIFQNLLKFHLKDEDPSAYADADLNRLKFCRNQVTGENRDERYSAALDRFSYKWKKHEISARADAMRARLAYEQGRPGVARMWAQNGAAAYPKSIGGAQCRNLIAEIEQPSVSFSAERVWCAPWPEMEINYKNLAEIQFRAVPVTFEEMFANHRRHDDQRLEVGVALLKRKPAKTWGVILPRKEDYTENTFRTPVPRDLKPGLYAVFAAVDGTFIEEGQPVAWGIFRVSKLALVVEQNPNRITGFVLDARSGEPVTGARVEVWQFDSRGRRYRREQTILTGGDGAFSVLGDQAGEMLLLAEKGGDAAQTWTPVWKGNERERDRSPDTRIVFFTDRSIYRPGQTVQYKGVYFLTDTQNGLYHTVNGKTVTVRFRDGNGKLIAEQEVRSNDYGSFSGCFTVPHDRGTGRMSLEVERMGQGSFDVEEYKRPKFDVTLAPPSGDARLSALVSLNGRAVAYSGVPAGGAKVAWRVVREVRYPFWRFGGDRRGTDQEIARGVTSCGGDGAFAVSFFAKPDPKVPQADEPVFMFRVTADVTDTTGETRTGERRVALGYTSWQATLSCDAWQTTRTPAELRVRVQTHNGESVGATGELKVFSVKQPDHVLRPKINPGGIRPWDKGHEERDADPSNPENWPDDLEVASEPVRIGETGVTACHVSLEAGLYRIRFVTLDPTGKTVTARLMLRVVDPDAKRLNIREPDYFEAESWRVEPGSTFRAIWGSGYGNATALLVVEQNGRVLLRARTRPGATQQMIEVPINEAMRGGIFVRTLFVCENRIYTHSRLVDVPWSNKRLTLKWEHVASRLEPGKNEQWRAVIGDGQSNNAVAEVVAVLYDRSLDAFVRNAWMHSFDAYFNRCDMSRPFVLANGSVVFDHLFGTWRQAAEPDACQYRSWVGGFSRERTLSLDALSSASGGRARRKVALMGPSSSPGSETLAETAAVMDAEEKAETPHEVPEGNAPSAMAVPSRRNLRETAFFLPHLASDANGVVTLDFTVPEALTGWRFMAFAHDRALRGGYLEAEAVTVKDLMVEPNPPRFVREGDEVVFAVKISNRSVTPQRGRARLGFSDAATLQSVDALLGNVKRDQDFELAAGESKVLEWRVRVPDGQGFMTYKAVAVTDGLVDGEEGWLPVLSRRVAVRESLALPLRGRQSKTFKFDSLAASKGAKTIRHQNLTVQMVSQPAWYAVLALPYLMEYPYECCEQTFNRYYAHALAGHIARSDPKIRAVFDRWKDAEALKSPLEKNEDLKAVMLEETPWLCEAESESAARRNVGRLFDASRLQEESARTLRRLAEMRIADGTWPWFPGGNRNDFITLYIVSGFGRLRQLGVPAEMGLAFDALPRLDTWMTETYKEMLHRGDKTSFDLPPTVALALYARSFFLKDRAVGKPDREAYEYFIGQARCHWQKAGRQPQAHLALALKRWGDEVTPAAILKSLSDSATVDEEMGMCWRDTELSWSWSRAPVETQALMIEALLEVSGDTAAAEACKVWLLKQKQMRDWKTTKATADAVYALLLRGQKLLGSDALVEVALAGQPVAPEKTEAGTGLYEKRFGPSLIVPEMGNVTVTKRDEGVAWGAVHWQYLDDLDRVKPQADTPLSLRKRLFVKTYTAQGPVLTPAQGVLSQGAELVTRIELSADRDMEFVHLKDSRASCAEPVNVLARYAWQDGLRYYESTRDTASHFFIDYLPKGAYVFEYACRLQQKGEFRSGLAEIQCLYAPEFNSHSESVKLIVGPQ